MLSVLGVNVYIRMKRGVVAASGVHTLNLHTQKRDRETKVPDNLQLNLRIKGICHVISSHQDQLFPDATVIYLNELDTFGVQCSLRIP
jgi:hypothetical protein